MSFLQKIGLKKKSDDKQITPPPKAPSKPGEASEKSDSKSDELPPLPGKQNEIRDLPGSSSAEDDSAKKTQQADKTGDKKTPLPPAPGSRENNSLPPPPSAKPKEQPTKEDKQEAPVNQPQKSNGQSSAREQLRDAFTDVAPIKSSQKSRAKVTDDDVKEFAVEDFRLPGEPEQEEQPPQEQPQAPSQPIIEDSQPLFIHINTYEDIQDKLKDIKKQVRSAEKHIEEILSEREKEDEKFSVFISELETIQDDLLAIDEDIFEEN